MAKVRLWLNSLAIATLVASAGVGTGGQQVSPILPPIVVAQPVPEPSRCLILVGDIVHAKSSERWVRVGQLVVALTAKYPDCMVVLLGDVCNDESLGTDCYVWFDRSPWGELQKDKLIVAVGNHDLGVTGGLAYIPHFSNSFGETGLGFQGINLDPVAWRMLVLHTDLDRISQAAVDEQLRWLRNQMQAHHQSKCLLAVMHRPPYSSGVFASPRARRLTDVFYQYGGDLVVAAHDHLFNAFRFIRPIPSRREVELDRSTGLEVVVVGGGGSDPYHYLDPELHKIGAKSRYGEAHQEILITEKSGVVMLELRRRRFEWSFIALEGNTSRIAAKGAGVCHDNPSSYEE